MNTKLHSKYFYVDPDKIKENLENVLSVLEEKTSFEGFLHYTDITNIESIIETKKLFSRSMSKEIISTDAASKEVLDHTDNKIKEYVRFYYKEKTPTIFNNEGIKQVGMPTHMPIPILLVFDKNIIFHNNIAFLDGGGGSHFTKFTEDSFKVLKFEWDLILERKPLQRSDELLSEEDKKNKSRLNNHRNAEFLYKESVSTEFIRKVYLRSNAELKLFQIINKNRLLCDCIVNQEKFFCKTENDFLNDYFIEEIDNRLFLGLKFFKFHKDFNHDLFLEVEGESNRFSFRVNTGNKYENIIKHSIPTYLAGYHYYFELKFPKIRIIEFYINGHLSLLWRDTS